MKMEHLNSRPQDLDTSKRWVVGAAIFQDLPTNVAPKLLLIKRSSHETAFPNAWELPGGHIEEYDETVSHAVSREVQEETSLSVVEIIGEIEPMVWESKSNSNIQLNYVATVQPGEIVKLNPDEHSEWKWVEEGDVEALYMTSEMREVVWNAFKFAVSHLEQN